MSLRWNQSIQLNTDIFETGLKRIDSTADLLEAVFGLLGFRLFPDSRREAAKNRRRTTRYQDDVGDPRDAVDGLDVPEGLSDDGDIDKGVVHHRDQHVQQDDDGEAQVDGKDNSYHVGVGLLEDRVLEELSVA